MIKWPGHIPVYLSYRTCIENYLLDPELLYKYWDEKSAGPTWTHKTPPPIADLESWIEDAGKMISDYQAIRWALATLRPGTNWPRVQTTWTNGSGHLPPDLGFDACRLHATDMVNQFRCNVLPVNRRAFHRYVDQYHQQFQNPSFGSSKSYLVWFQGKDIIKAMSRSKPGWISLKPYCVWAAQQLNWKSHPDLEQLSKLLQ